MRYIAQQPETNISKPTFGPMYQFFNEEELNWISVTSGRDKSAILQEATDIQTKFPNLQWFELSLQNTTEPTRSSLLVIYLANYGRISIPLEFSKKGLYVAHAIVWPDDNNALINARLLDEIWDYCINELGRTKAGSADPVIFTLTKMLLWISKPLPEAIQYIDEFEREFLRFQDKPSQLNYARHCMQSLRVVLANMGYPVEVVTKAAPISLWSRYCTPTEFINFNLAFEDYGNYLIKNKDPRTVRTILSNIRSFIGFLKEDFTDLTTLVDLERDHVRAYLSYLDEYIKPDGSFLRPGTVNHRIEALDNWLDWLHINRPHLVTDKKLITKMDKIAEAKKWPERISRSEIVHLFRAIGEMDETKWFVEKMALILLALTGLRINSILTLAYDCLDGNSHLIVHKIKGGKPQETIPLSSKAITCIKRLQKAFASHCVPLYSSLDHLVVRRLFIGKQAVGALSAKQIRDAFRQVQLDAGLVDVEGEPRYTPHDLRRIYASALLAQGLSPEEIAKLMLQDSVESLLPYEVNNPKAAAVMRKLDQSGILLGRPCTVDDTEQSGKEKATFDLVSMLMDIDVHQRQMENLQYKLKNPDSVAPLLYGVCVCGNEIDCEAGDDLICLGCSNYSINPNEITGIEKFLKQRFRNNWKQKDEEIKTIFRERINRVMHRVYIEQLQMGLEEALHHLSKLEVEVVPRRGRPKGGLN